MAAGERRSGGGAGFGFRPIGRHIPRGRPHSVLPFNAPPSGLRFSAPPRPFPTPRRRAAEKRRSGGSELAWTGRLPIPPAGGGGFYPMSIHPIVWKDEVLRGDPGHCGSREAGIAPSDRITAVFYPQMAQMAQMPKRLSVETSFTAGKAILRPPLAEWAKAAADAARTPRGSRRARVRSGSRIRPVPWLDRTPLLRSYSQPNDRLPSTGGPPAPPVRLGDGVPSHLRHLRPLRITLGSRTHRLRRSVCGSLRRRRR